MEIGPPGSGEEDFWRILTIYGRGGLSYQIWPCHKLGQGQPRVIIWTNYDGLESPMLHYKFHGNQSTGSGEDFWSVFYLIWAWRPFWSCDQHHVIKFSFPCTWKLTYKIWLKMAQCFFCFFLEKKVLIFICKCPGAKVKKWHWPSILTYLHKFKKMSVPTNFQVTGCNHFWKIQFSQFLTEKPMLPNLTLAVK